MNTFQHIIALNTIGWGIAMAVTAAGGDTSIVKEQPRHLSWDGAEQSGEGKRSGFAYLLDEGFLEQWRTRIAEARRSWPEAFDGIDAVVAAYRTRDPGTEWIRGVYCHAMLKQTVAGPTQPVVSEVDADADAAMSENSRIKVNGLHRKLVSRFSEKAVEIGRARNAAARMAVLDRFLNAMSDGDIYEQVELLDAMHALWGRREMRNAQQWGKEDGIPDVNILLAGVMSDSSRPSEVRQRATEWLFSESRIQHAIELEMEHNQHLVHSASQSNNELIREETIRMSAGEDSEASRSDEGEDNSFSPFIVRVRPKIGSARACALVHVDGSWIPAHFECAWDDGRVVALFANDISISPFSTISPRCSAACLRNEMLAWQTASGSDLELKVQIWKDDIEDQAIASDVAEHLGWSLGQGYPSAIQLRQELTSWNTFSSEEIREKILEIIQADLDRYAPL